MGRHAPADDPDPAETLEPGLLAFIEALARAHVDEDYAAAQVEETVECL
jgi:hypothetical protein